MRNIKVNQKYKHFKGMVVEVVALAKDSEDLSLKVVYKHDDDYWVRPYEEFISKVDKIKYPDIKQKYRFEWLGEDE